MTPLEKFLHVAPPIDNHREDAARCCEETARMERGERGPLRLDIPNNEFSDAAAGIAAEVVMVVSNALKSTGMLMRIQPAMCWDMAAKLLRGGWQRDHRLQPMVMKGRPS